LANLFFSTTGAVFSEHLSLNVWESPAQAPRSEGWGEAFVPLQAALSSPQQKKSALDIAKQRIFTNKANPGVAPRALYVIAACDTDEQTWEGAVNGSTQLLFARYFLYVTTLTDRTE
jgi:hypothetical protein